MLCTNGSINERRRTFSAACSLCDAVCCLSSGQWHVQQSNQMHVIEMAMHTHARYHLCKSITFASISTAVQLQVPGNIIALKILFVQFSIYIVVHFSRSTCLCVERILFFAKHIEKHSFCCCMAFDHIHRRISRALSIYMHSNTINLFLTHCGLVCVRAYVRVCVWVCNACPTFLLCENSVHGWERSCCPFTLVVGF